MSGSQEDQHEAIGPLLTEVGQEMAVVLDRYPEGALLCGEAGDGWSGGAIFIEEESGIRWIQPSHEIFKLLREIWMIGNVGKSEAEGWICMEYHVRDEKFRASFTYRNDVPAGSEYEDWEDAAVAKRFGDKPVIYPPMDGEDDKPLADDAPHT